MQEYKTIKQIGKGAFGAVDLIELPEIGQVALKCYKKDYIADVRKEYLFLKTLNGKGVPRVYDFSSQKNELFMEFIDGEELSSNTFPNLSEKYNFMKNFAIILGNIHNNAICLNDIKPENIIIKDGLPTIIDLGLATINRFSDNRLRGTVGYSSPEKIKFTSNHYPADIFALGIVWFFLNTGKIPADNFDKNEYFDILLDNKKWDEMVVSMGHPYPEMLSSNPLERPDAKQVAEFFAEKSGNKLKQEDISGIKNYIFPTTIEQSKILFKDRVLNCDLGDEPELIAQIFALNSEIEGVESLILNEEEYFLNPQNFFINYPYCREFLKDDYNPANTSRRIILLRNQKLDTRLFINITEKYPNTYTIYKLKVSKPTLITENDFSVFASKFVLSVKKRDEICSNYNLMTSQLAKLYLFNNIYKKKISKTTNEIISFMEWINYPIPVNMIIKSFNESAFHDLISTGKIQLESNSIKLNYSSDKSIKLEEKLLNKLIKVSSDECYFVIAGLISYKLGLFDNCISYWENHIKSLIKFELYTSALDSLNWMQTMISWEKLGYNLQKKTAFLTLKCFGAEKALSIYDEIDCSNSDNRKATILLDKAVALNELCRYEEAISLHEKAIKYFEQAKNVVGVIRATNNLGVNLYYQKRLKESIRYFRSIIDLSNQYKENKVINHYNLVANNNLSEIFLKLGQWKKAIEYSKLTAEQAQINQMKNLQILADVTALTAGVALGQTDHTIRIINDIKSQEHLKENKGLLIQILSRFLLLTVFLDEDFARKISQQLLKEIEFIEDDEDLVKLYLFLYEQRDFVLLDKISEKIASPDFIKFINAMKNNRTESILMFFREFESNDDVFFPSYVLAMLMKIEKYQKNPELKKIALEYYELSKFGPLGKIFSSNDTMPEKLPLLWDVVSTIHSKVEFDEIMKSVLTGILKICGLDRVVYFVYDKGTFNPEIALNSDLMNISKDEIRVSKTVLSDAIKSDDSQYYTDLQEDLPYDMHSSIFGLGLRSAVCFPIKVKGDVYGVIYSDATSEKSFLPEEKKMLDSIFIQAGSAFEKAFLIKSLRTQKTFTEENQFKYDDIIGKSSGMTAVYKMIQTIAPHNVNVMIHGETGTGKELIARAIHKRYAPEKPFIPVNCAAIPEQLLESELFGYVKGAFTGAIRNKKGLIRIADGGTLFLDEIGDMPPTIQVKLLRVLQDREVTPLGGEQPVAVDIRLITATHKDLENAVNENEFRQDLFYRLNVVKLNIPPLRERIDDIPLLIHHFIEKFNLKFTKKIKGISKQALELLNSRQWKGNVRELENEIERAMVLCDKEELYYDLLTHKNEKEQFNIYEQLPLIWSDFLTYKKRVVTDLERVYAKKLMKEANKNISEAGRIAQMKRTQIYRILGKENKEDSNDVT